MKPRPHWIAIAAGVLVLALLGWVLLHKGGGEAEGEPMPTATVTVAAVRSQTLQELAPAYGAAQAGQGGTVTVASPKAAVISRVLVGPGQVVGAGQGLVELANAPVADLGYKQAADAASFAATDLQRVQRLVAEHLAANDQLSAAQKTLADAKAALAAQTAQGTGQRLQLVRASGPGVVMAVTASAGDRVAQDASLMTLASQSALVAKLSIEPGDAVRVAPGQVVTLTPVFAGAPFTSRLATVGRQADPATRAIDATAPLDGARLAIGAALRGEVVIGQRQGLLAPRAAVVFDETGPHVFTIAGGKARRVFVKVGADHGDDIEVSGLAAGALVAVVGAYELQDGMNVRTRP